MSTAPPSPHQPQHPADAPTLTITVLGCGTMGVAILSGILASLAVSPPASGTSTPSGSSSASASAPPRPPPARLPDVTDGTAPPPVLPSRFVCCVKRPESAQRVANAFARHTAAGAAITVLTRANVQGARAGDVILLCCKPQMYREIMAEEGMAAALEGKLLVSILAGVTIEHLRAVVPQSTRVVRAMPNTASKIRESMTVISTADDLPAAERTLVSWIFSQIGRSLILGEKHMDACTALCGSGPAFYALFIEAMADGAVMMGLPRAEAQMMAAQTMQGAGRLVLSGQHPAIIREQVSTPAGCTIGGLLMLEDGGVRSTIARAIQEATNMAAGLGSSKKK